MRYAVDSDTGCWLWLGALNNMGYAPMSIQGARIYAHRAMYTMHVGPIPRGYDIDHLCRTPRCVNPAHLELVTHAENMRRGRGARLTEGQVQEMRRRRAEGATVRGLATEYGVSNSHASRLLRGLKWAEPQDPNDNRAHMRKAS